MKSYFLNRGSYLSAYLCFIKFIKRVEKSDKMPGLSSILSLFCNEFNKFNSTGARMLDFIYHMALNYFEIIFWREKR